MSDGMFGDCGNLQYLNILNTAEVNLNQFSLIKQNSDLIICNKAIESEETSVLANICCEEPSVYRVDIENCYIEYSFIDKEFEKKFYTRLSFRQINGFEYDSSNSNITFNFFGITTQKYEIRKRNHFEIIFNFR